MENGISELKQLVCEVIKLNENDGIVYYLEKMLNL